MFERFTDRARRVIVLAQDEARSLNHGYIGTEHLLVGLLAEGTGFAARALDGLDIELAAIRQDVAEIIGPGSDVLSGHTPFTPRAKKVLELALREALGLGHNYIGTEHVLLGLIAEGEGVAAQVLVKRGAALDQVRVAVLVELGKDPAHPSRRRAPDGPSAAIARRATINAGAGPTDMQLVVEESVAHLFISDPATVAALRNLSGRILGADSHDDTTIDVAGDAPDAAAQLWTELTAALQRFVEHHPADPPSSSPQADPAQ